MSSAKRTATTLFLVGSILLLVFSVIEVLTYFLYYNYRNPWIIASLIGYVLLIPASILIMVGIIKYRSSLRPETPTQPMFAQTTFAPNAASARFCPKCGRQIPAEAVYCQYCGWKP